MNRFELFCMIFYALDAEWDESQNGKLGEYLSGANPFLFDDNDSADPAIFAQFCNMVPETVSIEDSYTVALSYIDSLNEESISSAFRATSQEEWTDSVKDYLAEEHKGSDF